jgi:uncharacterized Tic20 family protein
MISRPKSRYHRMRSNIDLFSVMLNLLIVAFFIATPVSIWYSNRIDTDAINAQCGTQYSQFQVLMSGDTLKQLCQIKEQQIKLK